MGQWLRAVTVLLEDLGSIPSTNTAENNCSKLQFQEIQHSHTDIYAGETTMYRKKIINCLKRILKRSRNIVEL